MAPISNCGLLQGRSILLVESQALVALDMADLLQERGARQVQIAAHSADAIALFNANQPDLVILAMPGHGQDSLDFARSLLVRDVPFIFFCTDAEILASYSEFASIPVLLKPVSMAALDAVLRALFLCNRAAHQ